jgi:hypothetical protein
MADIKNNTFIGQRIQLDDNTFDKNIFKNCVLVYGGGPLNFSNNSLDGVQWEFVDSAARTLGLLSSFYQSGGDSKEFVEFLLSTFGKKIEELRSTIPEENAKNE